MVDIVNYLYLTSLCHSVWSVVFSLNDRELQCIINIVHFHRPVYFLHDIQLPRLQPEMAGPESSSGHGYVIWMV